MSVYLYISICIYIYLYILSSNSVVVNLNYFSLVHLENTSSFNFNQFDVCFVALRIKNNNYIDPKLDKVNTCSFNETLIQAAEEYVGKYGKDMKCHSFVDFILLLER